MHLEVLVDHAAEQLRAAEIDPDDPAQPGRWLSTGHWATINRSVDRLARDCPGRHAASRCPPKSPTTAFTAPGPACSRACSTGGRASASARSTSSTSPPEPGDSRRQAGNRDRRAAASRANSAAAAGRAAARALVAPSHLEAGGPRHRRVHRVLVGAQHRPLHDQRARPVPEGLRRHPHVARQVRQPPHERQQHPPARLRPAARREGPRPRGHDHADALRGRQGVAPLDPARHARRTSRTSARARSTPPTRSAARR